jgi:hypothetical protein
MRVKEAKPACRRLEKPCAKGGARLVDEALRFGEAVWVWVRQ